jgi:hypothetical protein
MGLCTYVLAGLLCNAGERAPAQALHAAHLASHLLPPLHALLRCHNGNVVVGRW